MLYIHCICIDYIFALILCEEHSKIDSKGIKRHQAELKHLRIPKVEHVMWKLKSQLSLQNFKV